MVRGNKKKKKKKKNWKRKLVMFLVILILLAVIALIAIKVFTVKKVVVSGNRFYDDAIIEEWVLNDKYSWNTLYVYLKYRFQEPKDMPFVDTMEITMKGPFTINIKVYEKGMLGYVYLNGLGQNAYFDKDGFVVEASSENIEGIPQITGLNVEQVVLYEKLPIKSKGVLKDLLTITQMLKKYEIVPQIIVYGEDKKYILDYGGITVNLGLAEKLNEKIVRLSVVKPELEGMSGILHLESWTNNTTDITFEKSE